MPESFYIIFANIANNVFLHELKHCYLTNLPVTANALLGLLVPTSTFAICGMVHALIPNLHILDIQYPGLGMMRVEICSKRIWQVSHWVRGISFPISAFINDPISLIHSSSLGTLLVRMAVLTTIIYLQTHNENNPER